jgi:hypothetical protein
MAAVLSTITECLSTTDLRESFLPPLYRIEAKQVLEAFSDDEKADWKAAIKKGVIGQDWADLIAHRA